MRNLEKYASALGLELDALALADFDTLAAMLARYNEKFNLTAVTDKDGIELRHFADSLAVLAAGAPEDGASVIDVGCGAGFPSLPMKLARRDLSVSFLDSTAKKLGFIENVCECLSLADTKTLCGRAEELAHNPLYREKFDFAVSRGVANLAVLAECMLPFCKVGGAVLALKGGRAEDELEKAKAAIAKCGGEFEKISSFTVSGQESRIVIIRKVRSTPKALPRRWAQIIKDV